MATSDITYFEDLDSTGITCPHEDAFEPDGRKLYYRYIKSGTLSSDSFLPTQVNTSMPLPNGFDACIAKSVSVFDDLDGLINAIFRLPFNRGKKKHIGTFTLNGHDGVLKQTFDNINHHSWWRSNTFDITTVTVKEVEV
ncbi:hypothetical protein SAMN05428975_4000 [Mucilaginibacter sp. OK268]|uniref:hypothetical protein n=1 Tax=Mucilaginibacter sp. OK268 TaxID=1881048 RepID=UPI00088E6352|nr:hypothetical protein [Mucilaginibacter sp. OK268]SDP94808.1 hypothetical protein SAMN05428975_4000 [Mucilaginibacter sp. OK268]